MNAQGLPSFASSAAAGGVIGASGVIAASAVIGEGAIAMDFATALAALRPFLFKRALYLARGRDLAEDLVQTVLANALQARALFTPGTNLKAWAARILHNEFYSHHRRSWRSASLSDELAESIAAPAGHQESWLDLQQIACALNFLPDGQRDALIAVGLLGFSYEEVAVLLGQTLGTVKSRVSRARIALLDGVQSHGRSGRRLMPASRQAFETWLADLETMRRVACAGLASGRSGERPALPPVRRIRLKTDA